MTNQEFAAALREALSQADLTQGELAKAVGVHQSTISRWVAGEDMPRGRHLQALAATLDAPDLAVGGDQLVDEVLDRLVGIFDYYLDGIAADRAAEREMGKGSLTEEQRGRLIERDTPDARAEITGLLPEGWADLDAQDQREVMREIAARTAAKRQRSDPATGK